MNINNFASPEEYPVDLLADIFKKQYELAEKYHPIEKSNGFMVGESIQVGIHDKFGQHRIKDFCWRVTEELMESLEAARADDAEHCHEELADALHFMVELCLISGVDHKELEFVIEEDYATYGNLQHCMTDTIYHMGLACNCLKNKPWKQTQMLTDEPKFRFHLKESFRRLMRCFSCAGIPDEEVVYDLYFRKNKVNQFRQDSKY